MYKIGDEVGLGYTVLAAHVQENYDDTTTGVVLAYSAHKREYMVWSVAADGETHSGSPAFGVDEALLAYVSRVTDRLFTYHNKQSPSLTFESVKR